MQRYQFYVLECVSSDDLPSMPGVVMDNVNSRILPKLLKNPDWKELREMLWMEIKEDYKRSWQKSIVDYVLMDSSEKERLKIGSFPRAFSQRIIRAPVPWHDSFHQSKAAQVLQLFTTNRVMAELHVLWCNK